ncbi:MAG TPA: hypothetical protein VMJ93_18375 [Verrucomicrobiae bacterium]|nr:hypothetical protein [Verrucomicrobiae bacterium]
MARLTSAEVRGQLSAIAALRWQLFLHSLRTLGGRLEMVSRIFAFFGFAAMGLGGSIGLAFGAWSFTSHDNIEQLAFLFWPILLFWQLFPVMASAFAENVDFSALLRFPLSFPAYALVRIVYGASDPSTLVGSLWLLAVVTGVAIARVSLFPLAFLDCFIFALFNLFLARAVFSWFERWLATRRAREIMGVVFLVVVISFQFIGPLAGHFSRPGQHPLQYLLVSMIPYERLLPPGLAAGALAYSGAGNFLLASATTVLLAAYALGALWVLVVRLAAQYSGENLGEAAARPAVPVKKIGVRAGWRLPGLSSRVSAVVEKEFHYLSRSGPVLFTLIMPVVVLLIFRVTPGRPGHDESFLVRAPDYAFPVGAAYSMLLLTNILYNAFGADGAGIQVFFLLPIRFREIFLAKNIFYGGVLAAEMLVVWIGTTLIFRPPSPGVTLATLAGVLFAFLANLSAGNLLSLYTPKKFDTAVLGRQRLPTVTVFATLGIQAVVIGLGALVFFLSIRWATIWVAALALFGLAALALVGYIFSLGSVDRIALARREKLVTELARA